MLETFQTTVTTVLSIAKALPYNTATWMLLIVTGFFVKLFAHAHKNAGSPVNWEDMILTFDARQGRLVTDPYKLGYLVGCLISTWIAVALTDAGKLDFDIFGLYLAYLLGGAGWMSHKSGTTAPTDPK